MKALCVFSGGLDSMLAAQLIRGQGIDVLALFFETPFFKSPKARKSARTLNLPLKVTDIASRHLEVVKSPRYGFGAHMNPCMDCHALMFRIAGEMLQEEKAHFVISGEVLGQRPFSQNRRSLSLIASESGLGGLLLRPLSAKHLSITIPEDKGWVNRDQLLDFRGRSRKPQMEMAKRLSIPEYPSPAGGCLLTEKAFSDRLRDLLDSEQNPELREIELLKLGRHFRIGPGTKLVIGRNKKENEAIRSFSRQEDPVLTTSPLPGPTVLILGDSGKEVLEQAASIIAAYSDAETNQTAMVKQMQHHQEKILTVSVQNKEVFKRHLI